MGPLPPEMFELIARTSGDGIVIVDSESRLLFVNPAAAALFGYAAEELIGSPLTMLMPEEYRPAHRNGISRYLSSGVRHIPWNSIELPGLHRTGRRLPLEISFAEARNGNEVFFAGFVRDLSERHWSQARLGAQYAIANILSTANDDHALEKVLNAIGEHLGFAAGNLWLVDGDNLRWQAAWRTPNTSTDVFNAESSGKTLQRGEGLPGRAWSNDATAWIESLEADINFPRARSAAAAHLRSGFAFPLRCEEEVVAVMEYFSTHTRPLEPTLLEIFTAIAQQVSQYLGRRRAQQALRNTEERHRIIFENANDAFAVSVGERFRYVNQAYASMFGYDDPQQVIGVSIYDTLPAEQHAVVRRHRLQRLAGLEEPMRYEAGGRRRDGTEFPTEVRATDYWINGEMYTLAILRDTTREREAREKLLQSNAALQRANGDLEQFAYAASHDLQEPLRMIAIYSELLKRRHSDDLNPGGRQLLETITDAAIRINDLVKDLLSYTNIEGLDKTDPQASDPDIVVQEVKQSLMERINGSGAILTVDELPRLNVHRTHLVQLFQNLLNNSLKYRSAERTPRIHISSVSPRAGEMVELMVQDNGIGIESAYHERIFGIFKRLHSQGVPGTGIGLAICRRIVQYYGGTIWVESLPGAGSTFHFTLPKSGASLAADKH